MGIAHISSLWRSRRLRLAFGLALACGAAGPASAQFLQPYFHGYRDDLPPDDDELPRYGSRRAIARILGRAGYALVGPLGRRGDEVVATGVSRRDGQARFFIDPYEGEVLHITRLGPPPPPDERLPQDGPETRRPPAAKSAKIPPADAAAPRPDGPRPDAPRPADAPKPVEAGKAPDSAKPAEPPKVEVARPQPPAPSGDSRPEPDRMQADKSPAISAPAMSAPAKSAQKSDAAAASEPRPAAPAAKLPPRPVAARTTGGSHRAIVPPRPAEGMTVVTPSAPAAATAPAASARTPTSVASPKEPQ
ncbi:hypothetical protein [Methylocystis echinoides]|uniref:Uncharacterized protein n=1 Tax=Methylocystis echinoides TaxID=29468 RepID=A0A9W6LS11_9HYPH|nr:hypothetical protein [Methylocystis echinoides]GLI93007.1 hypothetical protein LMG27198_19990 [Methylocystis echinoides]